MKKYLLLIALMICCSAVLVGCSSNGSPKRMSSVSVSETRENGVLISYDTTWTKKNLDTTVIVRKVYSADGELISRDSSMN